VILVLGCQRDRETMRGTRLMFPVGEREREREPRETEAPWADERVTQHLHLRCDASSFHAVCVKGHIRGGCLPADPENWGPLMPCVLAEVLAVSCHAYSGLYWGDMVNIISLIDDDIWYAYS
jgi:hypothetical protein